VEYSLNFSFKKANAKFLQYYFVARYHVDTYLLRLSAWLKYTYTIHMHVGCKGLVDLVTRWGYDIFWQKWIGLHFGLHVGLHVGLHFGLHLGLHFGLHYGRLFFYKLIWSPWFQATTSSSGSVRCPSWCPSPRNQFYKTLIRPKKLSDKISFPTFVQIST
jgi:hypothetical protein